MDDGSTVNEAEYAEITGALAHGLTAAAAGLEDEVVAALDRLKALAAASVEYLFGMVAMLMASISDEDDPEYTFEAMVQRIAASGANVAAGLETLDDVLATLDDSTPTRKSVADTFERRSRDAHPTNPLANDPDNRPLPENQDEWPDWLRGL